MEEHLQPPDALLLLCVCKKILVQHNHSAQPGNRSVTRLASSTCTASEFLGIGRGIIESGLAPPAVARPVPAPHLPPSAKRRRTRVTAAD